MEEELYWNICDFFSQKKRKVPLGDVQRMRFLVVDGTLCLVGLFLYARCSNIIGVTCVFSETAFKYPLMKWNKLIKKENIKFFSLTFRKHLPKGLFLHHVFSSKIASKFVSLCHSLEFWIITLFLNPAKNLI